MCSAESPKQRSDGMVKGPLPRAGEEYPLAVHQLRVDESVRGSTAPVGGGLAGVCANEVTGGQTAGESRPRRLQTSVILRIALVDHP